MLKKIFLIAVILIIPNLNAQQHSGLPIIKYVDYEPENREWFVRFGLFQINFDLKTTSNSLPIVKDETNHILKIKKCLELAKANQIHVIAFPEVAVALPVPQFKELLSYMEQYCKENDAIIIAGTYYDSARNCKSVIAMPTGIYYSYKTRAAIFEASPLANEGMIMNDTLFVFRTKYGNILPLVCVDMISDDANYVARDLSNKGLIDILINITFNPKSQEFMREASSMTVRHPLFVAMTNVTLFKIGCTIDGDEYGNTSIFGSLNSIDFRKKLLDNIPDCYKINGNQLQPAYRNLLAVISPEKEGLLVYDINLRVIRTSKINNAPDQGYPTIKNLQIIPIK